MNYDLPDHPVIQNMERTGYPDGKEPTFPICPVCGEECEEIFRDKDLNMKKHKEATAQEQSCAVASFFYSSASSGQTKTKTPPTI